MINNLNWKKNINIFYSYNYIKRADLL